MAEFWLISAPGDKVFDKLCIATQQQNSLSTNYKFAIPDLKVNIISDSYHAWLSLFC